MKVTDVTQRSCPTSSDLFPQGLSALAESSMVKIVKPEVKT